MIVAIRGTLVGARPFYYILNVHDVFWKIKILKKDYGTADDIGKTFQFYIAKGNEGDTYGFLREEDKNIFLRLIKENGMEAEKIYNMLLLNDKLTSEGISSLKEDKKEDASREWESRIERVKDVLKNLGYTNKEKEASIALLIAEKDQHAGKTTEELSAYVLSKIGKAL